MKAYLLLLLAAAAVTASVCGTASSNQVSRSNDPTSEISNLRSEIPDQNGTSETARIPETININTATAEDLQRIPHVGASMAEKIIEHREKNGPFKRPEHLMLISGISDVRFRRIRHLIRVK
jgi:competence ComEA-like helix-hairpin-helix protein